MVRFPNGLSSRSGNDEASSSGRKSRKAYESSGSGSGSGYDPASRYDPTTMGRIADDLDLDPAVDPEEELFDHASHNLDLMGLASQSWRQWGGGPGGEGGGGGSGGGGGEGGGYGRRTVVARRCLLFAIVAAMVASASVAIGKTVGNNRNGSGSGSGGSGSADFKQDLPSSYQQELPTPPPDLATLCSATSVAAPGGYRTCQALCVRAECCFLPEGHWFSCYADQQAICNTYEDACAVLDEDDYASSGGGGATKSSGGDAIQDVDELESIGDHYEGEPYEDEEGYYEGQDSEPPQGGGAGPRPIELPPASPYLAQQCSPESLATEEGFLACSDNCAAARCCSESTPPDAAECAGGIANPEVCADYAPCAVKIGTPKTHPDSISSIVLSQCNTAALSSPEGVADCEDICQPAFCCFVEKGTTTSLTLRGKSSSGSSSTETVEGCRSESNDEWCDQYAACATVLHVNAVIGPDGFSSDEQAAETIAEACDDLYSTQGKDKCEDVCSPAECCFADGDMEICERQGLEDVNCDHYESCYPLLDARGGPSSQQVMVPRPPTDLENACSGAALGTPEGHQRCADACSVAQCCVTDIEVCKVTNPQMCGAYEVHCAQVWEGDYGEVTVPDPPADLESTCGGVTLADDLNFKQCDIACRPARCCDEDISVCKVLNPHMCDAYEVHCAVVWGDAYHEVTIPQAPQDLDRKCAGANLSDDRWATCDDACRPASCCDKNIDVCKVRNALACEPYEVHCGEVWGDQYQEVTVPAAPEELEEVCASGRSEEDGEDYVKCSNLCYMAKCCMESIESCKVLDPGACADYEGPCDAHWGVTSSYAAATTAAPGEVDSLEEDDAQGNAEANAEVDAGVFDVMGLAKQVVEACGSTKLRDVEGRKKCEDLCEDRLCCFDANEQFNCMEDNEDECLAYAACENLLGS